MKIEFNVGARGGSVILRREAGDKKFYGSFHAKGENALFHALRNALRKAGLDIVKKGANSDGHMLNEFQPILRTRKALAGVPDVLIHNGQFAVRGAEEYWNSMGAVHLLVSKAFEKPEQHLGKMLKKTFAGKSGIKVKVI